MASDQPPSQRRERAAALMREQRRREQRRRLVVILGALVVVAVVVVVIVVATRSSTSDSPSAAGNSGPELDVAAQIIPASVPGTPITQTTPKQVPNTTGVDGVIAYDTQGYPGDGDSPPEALAHDHVTTPVTYAVTPPVGGPHNAIWMNAGVYTEPVPNERAVHNLEHGAVWITYRPNLPAAQVSALQAFVNEQTMIPEVSADGSNKSGQANRYVDLSPWSSNDLPAPIVISSWGYQLQVTSPTDPRLQQFVDTFRNSSRYTPEYGSPVDGIPVQTGGVPAADGSAKANPAGSVAN